MFYDFAFRGLLIVLWLVHCIGCRSFNFLFNVIVFSVGISVIFIVVSFMLYVLLFGGFSDCFGLLAGLWFICAWLIVLVCCLGLF